MNNLYSNFAMLQFHFVKKAITTELLLVSEYSPKIPSYDYGKIRR